MVGGPHAVVSRGLRAAACLLLPALLLSAGSCAGGGGASTANRAARTPIPKTGFFETTPDGFDAAIRDSGGLPTVVNVWASWCVPCRAEAPLFREAASNYAGRVRFLGLNTQDALDDAKAFVREFDLPYANGFDPDGKVMEHLKVLGLPTTLFYLQDGQLAFAHAGEIQRDALEDKLNDLVAASRGRGG